MDSRSFFAIGLFRRLLRFSLTGICATAIHFLVALSLINILNFPPPFSNGAAFISATILSFFINTRWSFSSEMSAKIMVKFVFVSLLGFFLAMLIAWIAAGLGVSSEFGIVWVAIVVPPITFLLHQYWTYK